MKIYEQWQAQWNEPELTTSISEVGSDTNTQSKQLTFYI